MTRPDAIAKATRRAQRGGAQLVTERTAHPCYPGQTVYLTVAKADKRLWADDETLILDTDIALDVECGEDGMLTVTADPTTLARLGGRENFGPVGPVQAMLRDKIADAWYAAGCPKASR
jgi:hypothetical protein